MHCSNDICTVNYFLLIVRYSLCTPQLRNYMKTKRYFSTNSYIVFCFITNSQLLQFCHNAKEWLSADKDHVIAVHCKGGKGTDWIKPGLLLTKIFFYSWGLQNLDLETIAISFYCYIADDFLLLAGMCRGA